MLIDVGRGVGLDFDFGLNLGSMVTQLLENGVCYWYHHSRGGRVTDPHRQKCRGQHESEHEPA